MPKMEFDLLDIFAPITVAICFAVIVFLISFTCINWYFITQKDDLTVFEKFGARANLRLGPHTMLQIKRGGYASTYAREEEAEERRKLTIQLQQAPALEVPLLERGEATKTVAATVKH